MSICIEIYSALNCFQFSSIKVVQTLPTLYITGKLDCIPVTHALLIDAKSTVSGISLKAFLTASMQSCPIVNDSITLLNMGCPKSSSNAAKISEASGMSISRSFISSRKSTLGKAGNITGKVDFSGSFS